MRRYVAIRPSDAENTSESVSIDVEPLAAKRRRVGVSIACNACRRKKVRCDGNHPACSNCEDSTDNCTYRDASEISHESRLLLLEVVRLLNGIPDDEAAGRLRDLKKEIDTSVILSTLRHGDSGQKSLHPSTSTSQMADPFQTMELAAQNPNAYPILSDIGLETLQEATYQQLVHSTGGKHPLGPKQVDEPNEFGQPHALCDPRLAKLDITGWTKVPITSTLAAHAISLYLKTDHPLLGFFDPDLFISDLTDGKTDYCSSLLVSSLLYWACQMNSIQDPDGSLLSLSFCEEAERLWHQQKHIDSILNVAAVQFLSLGYMGQGRNHAVLSYLNDASHMAVRMGLFGVEDDRAQQAVSTLSTEAKKAHIHAAWGAFNWAIQMALFYRQPGLPCPTSPPSLPMLGSPTTGNSEKTKGLDFMGVVFPYLCQFWSILHEVALLYTNNGGPPAAEQKTLRFAEYKFRELLAWSNRLPQSLSRHDQSPHYVQVLHIWFHAAILDLFGKTVSGPLRHHHLRTFTSPESSPENVCEASTGQLKQLILNYRLNFTSSSYTMLWHVALTYLANAILYQPKEENWFFYFLLCVYGYERLRPCWRVTKSISTALLSLALRRGDISSPTARQILADIEQNASPEILYDGENVRASFMADLNLARSDPQSATVEKMAEDFEHNVLLQEYTNAFDVYDGLDN